MYWYFLIYSYYLTVSNWRSLTALSSVKFTQCSGSYQWGGYILRFTQVTLKMNSVNSSIRSLCAGISLYIPIILTVSKWCSLTALSSVKFTQCSGSWKRGGGKSENLSSPAV